MAKQKTAYKELKIWGSMDDLREISGDFLPKPEELILRPKLKKITIVLDEDSVGFFKAKADELNTSYQRMIRTLLHNYATRMKTHD